MALGTRPTYWFCSKSLKEQLCHLMPICNNRTFCYLIFNPPLFPFCMSDAQGYYSQQFLASLYQQQNRIVLNPCRCLMRIFNNIPSSTCPPPLFSFRLSDTHRVFTIYLCLPPHKFISAILLPILLPSLILWVDVRGQKTNQQKPARPKHLAAYSRRRLQHSTVQ